MKVQDGNVIFKDRSIEVYDDENNLRIRVGAFSKARPKRWDNIKTLLKRMWRAKTWDPYQIGGNWKLLFTGDFK